MRHIKFLFFFVLLPVVLRGQAVDSVNNISLSLKYGKGFMYAHHESFNYFIQDYIPSLEFNVSKRTDGHKLWHQLYRFPSYGFGYHYIDFGNPEFLGHANSLLAYISVPFFETGGFKFSYKCAGGVAVLSKHFDLYGNKYNIAIGSTVNAYLNLNLDAEIRLHRKFYMLTGVGLTHFSNGGTQQPNKGFNIFAVQMGMAYHFTDKEQFTPIENVPEFKRKNEFTVIYGGGVKTLEPARTKKYYVSSLSMNAERQISYKSRLGLGVDLFKDNSRKEYLVEENIPSPSGKDLFYAGGHFSYDLVFGKTSFTIQMGAYLWQKSKSFESVYHRFGLKYRFSEHFLANLTLKTYWAAADFAEWGIGYQF